GGIRGRRAGPAFRDGAEWGAQHVLRAGDGYRSREPFAGRSDHGGPERRGGLRGEAAGGEWKALRGRILLGRGAELPVRDESSGPGGRVRLLWAAAFKGCDGS